MNPRELMLQFANDVVERRTEPESLYTIWDYNNVLICEGIEELGRVLGQPAFLGCKQTSLDAFYRQVRRAEAGNSSKPYWVDHYRAPSEMWHCGLIAVTAELQRSNPSSEKLEDLECFEAFLERVPTLEDGTLVRQKKNYDNTLAIQIDDIFMLVPYWIQMWKGTGKEAYLTRAINETIRYFSYLWDDGDRLLHCLWLSDKKKTAAHYWCRGNGWFAVTIAMLMQALPKHDVEREGLLAIYAKLIDGWKDHQDADGLWHQVLTRPDSYQETSGSAMITYCILKGVNEGWLDESCREVGLKGWSGLLRMITEDRKLKNVCKATDMSEDVAYYLNRPHEPQGIHAIGPLLLSAAERFKC